jgi:hypothetical protein
MSERQIKNAGKKEARSRYLNTQLAEITVISLMREISYATP